MTGVYPIPSQGMLSTIGDGLWNAFLMAWEVWWALVLGFLISAIVQAWVPRERIEAALAGGILMIGLMWALLRRFVSARLEEQAREHAQSAQAGHVHGSASDRSWTDVARNFQGDWRMLWREITIGFLLAGFIALLGDDF